MNKRILHFVSGLETSESGLKLIRLLDGLDLSVLQVKVCVSGRIGEQAEMLRQKGISVESVQKACLFDLMFGYRLGTVLKHFGPDCVHIWDSTENFAFLKTALKSDCTKIIIERSGMDDPASLQRLIKRLIKRPYWNKIAAIVSHDEYFRPECVQLGMKDNQIAVISPGVPPPQSSSWTRSELVALLGGTLEGTTGEQLQVFSPRQKEGPFLIGLVEELKPGNRIKDVIWAANTMKVAHLDFHLLILGDGPERERLLRYRDALQLTDRIHFWGNQCNRDDFFTHIDILWCMNTVQSTSLSILDAMSAHVPVITVDHAIHRHWVVPEETGVLVPEFGEDFRRRRSQFVEQTFRLLAAPELRRKMGISASEKVQTCFSAGEMIRKYRELYQKTLP